MQNFPFHGIQPNACLTNEAIPFLREKPMFPLSHIWSYVLFVFDPMFYLYSALLHTPSHTGYLTQSSSVKQGLFSIADENTEAQRE